MSVATADVREPQAATPPLLALDGVAKRFTRTRDLAEKIVGLVRSDIREETVHAVDGVSLTIAEGEVVGLVGESGCGKSTLGRIVTGLHAPDEGEVYFRGVNLLAGESGRARHLRLKIQMIFQDPMSSLNPRLRVAEIVSEAPIVHGLVQRRDRDAFVAETLSRVGLDPSYARRYPHQFSGGQRQRIGIARALASGPRVLVGDEPVSALDLSIQAQIINLLQDLKDDFALTLVVIAHDLAVVRHMSDRIAVMYLGEVVELAPTEAFYDGPRHPYAQALLAAVPSADPSAPRAAVRLGGDVPSPTAPPPGCRFHTRCPHARERCRSERPVLRDSGPGRQAACHFFEEIEPVRRQSEGLRSAPNLVKRLMLYDRFRAREDAAPSI